MVSLPGVGNSTCAFDWLPTASTQGVVRLVIMVAAEWLAIVNIEFLVWEWFLLRPKAQISKESEKENGEIRT